jgi:hypothetical protein
LREICPPKKKTPNRGRYMTAIAGDLLRGDPLSMGMFDVFFKK